jgi:hypothetical protein
MWVFKIINILKSGQEEFYTPTFLRFWAYVLMPTKEKITD